MENKERFVRAIARFQNLMSSLNTRNELLESAFGDDCQIMEWRGSEETLQTIEDMAALMFPRVNEETLKDDIEWYLYECVGFDEESQYVVINGAKYVVRNSEELYDYLESYNNGLSEFTDEDLKMIDDICKKHIGEKDNPLTGKTFREILEFAKREQ